MQTSASMVYELRDVLLFSKQKLWLTSTRIWELSVLRVLDPHFDFQCKQPEKRGAASVRARPDVGESISYGLPELHVQQSGEVSERVNVALALMLVIARHEMMTTLLPEGAKA